MKVNVQTVHYKNSLEDFRNLFRSLIESCENAKRNFKTLEIEIRILLNESSAKEAKLIRSHVLEKLKCGFANVVYTGDNLGFAKGHNLLSNTMKKSDYTWFVNPDGYLHPNCLTELLYSIIESDNCVAAEAKQIPFDHPKTFDDVSLETNWVSFACTIVNSEIFRELQGFDERFFLYCEDVDFSWSVKNRGYIIKHVYKAKFLHHKYFANNGFPQISKAEEFHGILSALLLAHKWKLNSKLKSMIRELEYSKNPTHIEILRCYRELTPNLSQVEQINKCVKMGIPKETWKFSHTFFE